MAVQDADRPTNLERRLYISLTKDVEAADMQVLNETEQVEFIKLLGNAMEELDKEHTRLLALQALADELPANRFTWENNHLKITKVIQSTLQRTRRMPSQAYIAQATGISRKTVQQHLTKGDDHSVYADHLRQFSMMVPRMLDMVLSKALTYNDIKAARMYFDILDKMKGPDPIAIYGPQNNYIQINNTIIKQETLRQLSPEQLKLIEEMLQKNLPLPVAEAAQQE